MQTLSKVARYALALIAGVYFCFFLAEVGSSREETQEAAGRSFAEAMVCGAIAGWWFYAARKKQRASPLRPPTASELHTTVETAAHESPCMYCCKCGAATPADAIYCHKCGTPLRSTPSQTPPDSQDLLRVALALHENLAALIQGLLPKARSLRLEQEVEALIGNMVDASKEFEPGIATLTVASFVDRWLDELIGQSEDEGLSKIASATRQSLAALSKDVAIALQEEGWNKEQVTLQVSTLYRKILQISRDCDNYVTNLTVIISLDMYAKQLVEKLKSGRLEGLSSVGIAHTGDGKSQQTAILFTCARTQLEHIGLQHQFIRDKGIAVVGARQAVGGERGHLYDVWPTTDGQLWFKVPVDPDPRKKMEEMEGLLRKRRGS